MSTEKKELTHALRDALHIVSMGVSAVSTKTEVDQEQGVRCISGGSAKTLREMGLIRNVPHWNAVEITDAGRNALYGAHA